MPRIKRFDSKGPDARKALSIATCALALALLLSWSIGFAQPVSNVQFTVPNRTDAGQIQIGALKISLQLDNSDPIALSLSEASSGTVTTETMTLTSAANDCFAGSPPVCFSAFPNLPPGAVGADLLSIIKPDQTGADPAASADDKLTLVLQLGSNSNPADGCVSTMAADETWTLSVVGGAARIAGISVQSLDKQTVGLANPACGTAFRPIPLDDPPLATVVGAAPILAGGRVGVDAVLVLDRSGSMSAAVASGGTSKITRLGEATDQFIDMWQALRANECQDFNVNCPAIGGLPPIQAPTDRLGVVFFDQSANWLSTLEPGSSISGLTDLAALTLDDEKTNIKAVTPGGWTSIGAGLLEAANALTPAASEPNRKVILVMSDGKENRPPTVAVSGTEVQVTDGVAPDPEPLPNEGDIQIFGVTVGTGLAVDPVINESLAAATNGFYLNTEDHTAILPNLFVQVLQNSVKFGSVETLRILSESVVFPDAFETEIPLSTGTRSLAFNLSWPPQLGALAVRLIPPEGGSAVDFAPGPGTADGYLVGNLSFPRDGIPIIAGTWTLQVSSLDQSSMPIPFQLTLLGEDAVIGTALGPRVEENLVGGSILLTARVTELGQPVLGLDTQPEARVTAFVVKPGENLGDVLSDADVDPTPPDQADSASAAQRKLDALLAADPDALARTESTYPLRDDGSSANGDATAEDGVYSARVPTDVEGHYNIVFLVEGESEQGGRFVRQQIRTVHVRSMPVGEETECSTERGGREAVGTFITCIPRNTLGGRVGPGWQNYFWFTGAGLEPIRATDQLDGTYRAFVPGAATLQQPVTLHFISDTVRIPDDLIPTPEMLADAEVVLPDVREVDGGEPNRLGRVLLLLLLLLIAYLAWRRLNP